MQGAGHQRLTGGRLVLFRVPMDLRHFGAVGERLAVTGNTGLIRVDHRWVPEDHSKHLSVMTDINGLPAFVSLELGEREPIRPFERVPVLGGNRSPGSQNGERYRNTHTDQHAFALHRRSSFSRSMNTRTRLGHECWIASIVRSMASR